MGNEARRILVVGGTGSQGGSVARHLLSRGGVRVRVMTRDPSSETARALESRGAELVRADLDDPGSLRSALEGCDGCFGVTNFWEHFDHEAVHGRNLVDQVAASGVDHFVFSTLPNVKELTNGEIEVPHFDLKGEMEARAREAGIPATFVHMAFYYENFLAFPPQRQADGSYLIGFPQGDTPLAAVSVEDMGGVVAEVFARPDDFLGETLYLVGDDRPMAEYAEIMTRVLGVPVRYTHIPRQTYASFGFPGAEEMANMFEFYRTRVPERREDLERTRSIYPQVRGFEAWLRENAEALRQALPDS